jgi:RimJ/RimL family protein N-acetyltransferase
MTNSAIEGPDKFRSNEDPMVVNWKRFHFRPMKLDDLPLMHRWVNTPHVREWWDALPTFDAVVTNYAPRVLGKEPTRSFVVEAGSRPVGYIQSYRITDYPDYARYLGSDDCAAGVDLFVGEAEFVGHGAGQAILREFLRTVVFADEWPTECLIGPEIENHRAIRSYQKAGFSYWKTVQIPGERAPEYVMRITRREFEVTSKISRSIRKVRMT